MRCCIMIRMMSMMVFVVFCVIRSSMTMMMSMVMWLWIRDWMRVHLHGCRVFGSSSRFVGLDMCSETVFVSNVVNMSVNSMGIFVAIRSLDFVRRVTLFMSILSVSVSIMDIVSKTVRLIMTVMLMMVVVMIMMSCCRHYY